MSKKNLFHILRVIQWANILQLIGMGTGYKQVKYNMGLKVLSAKGEKGVEGTGEWKAAGGKEEFQCDGVVRKFPWRNWHLNKDP